MTRDDQIESVMRAVSAMPLVGNPAAKADKTGVSFKVSARFNAADGLLNALAVNIEIEFSQKGLFIVKSADDLMGEANRYDGDDMRSLMNFICTLHSCGVMQRRACLSSNAGN